MFERTLLALCSAALAASCAAEPTTATADRALAAPGACRLGKRGIEHVIYLQFDNTHLRRDKAEVPSDLEQMPHLLAFIQRHGALLADDHTVLISHTAGGILSTLTGVYPDRHGQTVSNSYVRTSPTGTFSFPSSFGYWTDPVAGTVPNMVTPTGANAPAPWVAYTEAGCDVGAIASANLVLENTGTGPSGDMTKIFGAGSPEYQEAKASSAAPAGTAARALAQTDFVGLAVHCAYGSATCAGGHDDLLPDEPGGYLGFDGLFGAKEVNPALTGGASVTDLDGNVIADPFGQPGFPGFDGMSASVSLSYVAEMQERGIPVTFAYISDAHDFHGVSGNAHVAYGPGSAGYVAQLAAYDRAFDQFFQRLAADGIDDRNTLFVFTVDEGDHFVGGTPAPAGCDGVHVPCDWTGQVGEINANLDTLIAAQAPAIAGQFLGPQAPYTFTVHGDDAPPFYLAAKGAGPLGQTDPAVRAFERAVAQLTAVNPYTGATDRLLAQMADQAGMRALHMVTTGDPARNPTFAYFADPDYFLTDFPSTTCATCINPAYAWNHGDIQREIARTWIGLVGPGVQRDQVTDVWTDHTDVRPTMLALLGLRDPDALDGRVVTEVLEPGAVAPALRRNRPLVELLGAIYKQVNAPFGGFGQRVLAASTHALAGDDARYAALEPAIADLTARRDAYAAEVRDALDAAEFSGQPIDDARAIAWIVRGQCLLGEAFALSLW
jgi:hypothetical protein